MSVVLCDEAISDLDEIARYIGQNNPQLWLERSFASTGSSMGRSIGSQHSGRVNPANNTRELAVPYLIIYPPAADAVDMIAIFHTSRDPSTKRQP